MLINGLPITPTAADGSTVLAAAATSQKLCSAGKATRGAWIYNPSTAALQGIAAAESIFVDITGATAVDSLASGGTSIEVLPGAMLNVPEGVASQINWIAATLHHAITAVVF